MEMLCASPCLTAMICFSMEVKYGNMLNSHALMQRHRVGARGNATTFLLPWESILLELERLEEAAAKNNAGPTLPRTGEDLKHVVQVLLKSSDEDKRDDLKHFIHQAHVNRQKVLNCILGMKRRGHRAYMHVDEADARRIAEKLPEHGVPPELISLLPDDSSYDKLKIQKAATPVEGMKTTLNKAGESFKVERPNAVVLERSALEESDIQHKQYSALANLVRGISSKEEPTGTPSPAATQADEEIFKHLANKLTLHCILQLAASYLDSRNIQQFLATVSYTHLTLPTKQAV